MSDERTFPNESRSIPLARRYTIEKLAGVTPDICDAIAVLVSELATNSVRHASSDFTVSVEREPHQIRVAVSDAGAGVPFLRSPSRRDASGRGLQIVRELADDWGVRARADGPGKTVWFTLTLEPPRHETAVDGSETRPVKRQGPDGSTGDSHADTRRPPQSRSSGPGHDRPRSACVRNGRLINLDV